MAELSPEAFGFSSQDSGQKELPPSAFGLGDRVKSPTATDYLKGAAAGSNQLAGGIGYLLEKAGAERVGKALREVGAEGTKYWQESMTPAGQRAAQSQVFEDDPGAAVPVKLGDRWGQALAMGAAQSAPSMLAAAIPGGIATAGLRGAAGMAASRGIGGALAPLAAGTAAPIGGWATNSAGNLAARVPTALGFGAAEGAVAGATNAAQWKSDIEQKPLSELRSMPGFAALEEQIGEEAARQQIAEKGAADIMAHTTLATGGIGALTGGGALGSAFQRATTGAKGGILGAIGRDAAKEAGQEIPQSGGERAIQNIATRDYLDPSQSLSQGVLADALSGGAIGGVMGGVTGGGSHLAKGPLQKAAESRSFPPDSRQIPATFSPQAAQVPPVSPASTAQPAGIPSGQTPAAPANVATPQPASGLAAAAQNTQQQSPEPGFVRYYHGGSPETVDGPLWFTSDLRDAEGWASRSPGMGIWYVDVPADHPSVAGDPAFGVLPPSRVELPKELSGLRRKLQRQSESVQNTPAAPENVSSLVSTAASSLPTNQAESAGVPVYQSQEGTVSRGNQTEIAKPAEPGQQAQPTEAADSAKAEREWRDFVASDGRSIGPRQLAVVRAQFMRRRMLNAGIEEATARVEDARQREVAQNRMAILDALPLTTAGNTIRRFAASLRKAGIRDFRVSPEERQLIARRIAARDTLQSLDQVPPNELTLPEKRTKQAQPTMPRIESLRRRAAMPGVRIVGNRMLDRHEPKQEPARTVEDTELADFIKSESADLGKRRAMLRSLQAIRRQKQADADNTDLEDLIEAERADLRERFARLLDAQAAARAKKPFVIPPLMTPEQPTTTRVMEQQATDIPLGKYGKAEPAWSAVRPSDPKPTAKPEQRLGEAARSEVMEAWPELPVPSYIDRNRAMFDVTYNFSEKEKLAKEAGASLDFGAYTIEYEIGQLHAYRSAAEKINGALLGKSRGASPAALISNWISYNVHARALANWAADNPDKWEAYKSRQERVKRLAVGDQAFAPYKEMFGGRHSDIGKYIQRITRKNKVNWSLDWNGSSFLYPPSSLMTVDDALELSGQSTTANNAQKPEPPFPSPTQAAPETAAVPKPADTAPVIPSDTGGDRKAEYEAAAKRFLEGPLTTPLPPAKAKAVELIPTDKLSNVRPRPIERKVAPAKAFAAQFRAMLSVAGNKDIRRFINGVHIEDSGRLVATDGSRLAVVDGADVSSVPAKPEKLTLATVLGRDGQWVEGKFPDYKRVMPEEHKTQPETVDATAIGDAARGIVRATRYTSLSTIGGGPMPLRIGNLTQTYDAQYIADAADLFRAFGYSSFEARLGNDVGRRTPLYLRSPDGKVQQVIMPRTGDPGESPFAPYVVGQDVVTKAPEVKQDAKKAAAKPETAAPTEKPESSPDDMEKLQAARQLLADNIETKRLNRQTVPTAWTTKLAEVDAKIRGESDPEAVYSMVVEGHPMFDGSPMLRNLIPIKVTSLADAERKLFAAQDLYSKLSGDRAKAKNALSVAKTAQQKKAAQKALLDLNDNGVTEDAVDTLRQETLPELQRIVQAAEDKFGSAKPAPAPAAAPTEPTKPDISAPEPPAAQAPKTRPARPSKKTVPVDVAGSIIGKLWQTAVYNNLKWPNIKARAATQLVDVGASKQSVIAALDDAMTEFARNSNGRLGYPNETTTMRALIRRGIVEPQSNQPATEQNIPEDDKAEESAVAPTEPTSNAGELPAEPASQGGSRAREAKWFALGRSVMWEIPIGYKLRPQNRHFTAAAEKLGISVVDARRAWNVFQNDADAPGTDAPAPSLEPTADVDNHHSAVEPLKKPEELPARKATSDTSAATKIDDFGEKLEGARKDYATQLKDAMDVDVASEPLSKSWPEPDYQKLLNGGADPYMVAFVRAVRDELPTKPQTRWKLAGWVAQAEMLRDMAQKLLSGNISASRVREMLQDDRFRFARDSVGNRAELYEIVGHSRSLKGVTFAQHFFSLYKGQENVSKWVVEQKAKATAFSNWPRELAVGNTKEEVLTAFKEKFASLELGSNAKRQPQFVVYRKRGEAGAWIGKKIGREYIDLHKTEDVAEARKYMAENLSALEAKLARYKETPFERNPENQPRVGDDHRNGAPATPNVFAETFSFRGVQFGNYVEQGRRQSDLNEAFDGLMDLAAVLGVPPRALSLNGRLGLAFGSRGRGGRNATAAHFEPDRVVINLTKGGGPGSLAHEWWHSLDNYFAKQSNDKSVGFVTSGAETNGMRDALRAAFNAVKRATSADAYKRRSSELDKRRSKPYWNMPEERSARAFEGYVIAKLFDQGAANDYLVNVVSNEAWDITEDARSEFFGGGESPKTYPYPTVDEMPVVRAAFDEFFKTVETKAGEDGNVVLYSGELSQDASPADRAVYAMAAEGKTAAEILAFLGKASRRPFNRYLANALKNLGASSTITLDEQGGFAFGNRSYAQKYAAAYNSRTDTVALFTPREAERHILHELVHAATMKAIKAGGPAAARMRALFRHVQKSGKLDGKYGMSSIDEFVAEAFSNPRFQEALRGVPAPAGSTLKSAWQWFVRVVARMVGIRTQASETALDRAMTVGAQLMNENAALASGRDAVGDTRYAIAWHGTPHVWAPEPGFPHGRPRLDKMGSGEGAQAYGWGWYSAQAQDVAKSYQTTLTADRGFDFGGKSGLTREQVQDLVNAREGKKYLDGVSLPSGVADRVIDDIVYGSNGRPLPRQYKPGSERAALYQKLVNEIRHTDDGSLYQLDIPDDVMPKLLDWDKPLSEQSPEVQNALAVASFMSKWASAKKRGTVLSNPKTATGSDMYHVLKTYGRAFHGAVSDKAASEYLASLGIPGLRYLDGSSRSKGSGTYNYVIWDQKVLDRIALLERNGKKLDAIRAADEMRFSLADSRPFDGPEVAATPLKPGATTLMVDGTERPALNSNGKPIHWSEEGVRNFWRWFGDSHITERAISSMTDKRTLRPRVLFHGTKKDLTEFAEFRDGNVEDTFERYTVKRIGVFLTENPQFATTFAKQAGGGRPNIIPLYAKITNPMYLEDGFKHSRNVDIRFEDDYVLKLKQHGFSRADDLPDTRPDALWNLFDGDIGRDFVKAAISAGYDGAVITEQGIGLEKDDSEQTTIVAFSPTQIKSATGNSGAFSPSDPDIRFNIATDWQQSPVAQEVAKAFKAAARSDASLSWLNPFQTQYHKAETLAKQGKPMFKRVFDLGQKFLSDISRFAVMAENSAPTLFHQIRSLADAEQAVRSALSGDFGKQHNADIKAIAAPLYEGTLYGGGNPMAGIVWTDEQLRSRFGLNDRQIGLYREAREAVRVSMEEMAKSLISRHAKREHIIADTSGSLQEVAENVRDTLKLRADVLADKAQGEHDDTMRQAADLRKAGEDKRAAAMEGEASDKLKAKQADVSRIRATVDDVLAIAAKAQKLQDAGYFPLMRFGRHTVTAKDEKGNVRHFSMHDGIPLVPRSGQVQANRLADALREEHPDWTVTTGLMNPEKYKLYQGMNVEALQLFSDHLDDATKQTYQEIIRLSTNDRSALRRMLKREGTPGFDRDVRRTLASFILSNARYTASSYHLSDMAKAAELAEQDGGDIGAEAVKLYDYVTKPQEEAAKLRGFLFFNFLGGSLAAAMVNATQVPMMTFPRLAQYEDAGKLAARLARAAKVAVQNPADVTGDVGYALRRAEEDGVTAPHQIYEMTATASANVLAGSKAGSAIMRAWGAPFALAEAFNRRTTFVAAYQIGQEMTVNQLRDAGASSAFEFAQKIVNETQGIYNRGNRMNIGRGAIPATVMTFKQYSVMYLEMFSRLPPKQKAIMAGVLILAAGAGGLPFAEDVEDIIDTIGQWLGYRTNTRRTIRRGLADIAGQRAADIAMNGVLSQVGIDLHSRLGLQNLIPGSALLKPSTTDKSREFQDLLGPAASVVAAMGQALQDLATGRPDKAALAMAPVAVQNAAKGIKMAATGRAEDARGKPTIPVSLSEAGAKAIGFNPKSVADYGAVKRASTQDDRLLDVTRERFTSAIVDAIMSDNDIARREAVQEVADWNRQNPEARITINPAAIRRRVIDMRADGPSRVLKSLSPSLRQQARQEFANAQG